MKKFAYLFWIFIFLTGLSLQAQKKYVEVIYGKVVKSVKDLSTEDRFIPGLEYRLIAGPREAYTYPVEKFQEEDAISIEKILFYGHYDHVYYDLKDQKKRIFMLDKNLVLEDELYSYDWKISKVQKEILGYTCYRAEAIRYKDVLVSEKGNKNKINVKRKKEKIIAWFTPEIPYPYGPLIFSGLPGLVLEVSTSSGRIYYKAQSILWHQSRPAYQLPKLKKHMTFREYEEEIKKFVSKKLNFN